MANCEVCGNPLKFSEGVKTLGKAKRCDACITLFSQASNHWLGVLQAQFNQYGVPSDTETAIVQDFQRIRMPIDLAAPVMQRFQYLHALSNVRWGYIPIIRVNIHLDSDEIAHFEIPTSYLKPTKTPTIIPGKIIGTNKKMYFVSSSGSDGMTIDWNNVSSVEVMTITELVKSRESSEAHQIVSPGVKITIARGPGGGRYTVPDPLYTKIIIDTLVRLWKRQLVLFQEQKTSGAIPDHIKAAVYQRDGGKCVQCGYQGPYIEYDHRVPRSKGGQNTVENIQLLCRMCNLKKGARI